MKKLFLVFLFQSVVCSFSTNVFAQDNTPPEYPFSYDSYTIVAEGTINDSIKADFCLDTGAGWISLDRSFCEEHNISKKGVQPSVFGGGAGNDNKQTYMGFGKSTYKVADQELTFGSFKVYEDLGVDVLMGIEPEYQLTFEIYYDRNKFRLYKGKAQQKFDNSWTRIKFKTIAIMTVIPMKIKIGKKTISGDFLFDTGSAHGIFLTAETAKKHKLDEMDIRKWKAGTLGVSGGSTGATIGSESVRFGKDEFKDVDIHYTYDESGALAGSEFYIGVVGNRIFEKYDVVVDYVKSCIYIRPNSMHDTPIVTTAKNLIYE